MQKKLFSILCLMGVASAEASVIVRSFVVKFKNAADSSAVSINTVVNGEDGESIKVASFSDFKGATYTVANTASYNETLKKFTNTFLILKKEANSNEATTVAQVSAPCVVREGESCRASVESEALSAEVESAVGSEVDEEFKSVDVTIAAFKGLLNEATDTSKTLEDLSVTTTLKAATETLVYSDSQSKASLSAKADLDQYANVGLLFKGKDGFVFLNSRSGQRSSFELEAKSPVPGFQFKRSLDVEPVAGNSVGAAVQIQSANVQAKIEQLVGTEYRSLHFDTSLAFDSSSLKPDPAQTGYTAGKGLLVLKEEQNLENSTALETYWDIEPVEATDAERNRVRTQVYKVKTNSSERVIKIRSNSGQRAQLELADTPDPTKKDISVLELDFALGASAAANPAPADPFAPVQPAQPGQPVDPFRQ